MTGEYPAALLERKQHLTEQLRRIDEAVDTATGEREEAEGDWPVRRGWDAMTAAPRVEVQIDGEWHEVEEAETLTRAGLHEVDQGLEDLGLLPAGGE